jgi:hypothetical protein
MPNSYSTDMTEFSTSDSTIGFVLDGNSVTSNNFIKAYVPKFMTNIDMGNNIWTKKISLDNKLVKNENINITFSKNIIEKNYVYLQPYDIIAKETNIVSKGDHIEVEYLDGDLRKGRFTPNEVDGTDNQYNNSRLRWYVDNSSTDKSNTKTSSTRYAYVDSEDSNSSEDEEDDVDFTRFYNNTRKTTSSSTTSSSISNSKAIYDNKTQTTSSTKTDTYATKTNNDKYYDIILDSVNGKAGFRIESSNVTDDMTEDALMEVMMERLNQVITLKNENASLQIKGLDFLLYTTNGGIFKFESGKTQVVFDNSFISLTNGSMTVVIEEDGVKFYNDGASISLTKNDAVINAKNIIFNGDLTVNGDTSIQGAATISDSLKVSYSNYLSHVHSGVHGTTSGPRS